MYLVETYDPTDDGDDFDWFVFATALSARAAVELVRYLESCGYDRNSSIYVSKARAAGGKGE